MSSKTKRILVLILAGLFVMLQPVSAFASIAVDPAAADAAAVEQSEEEAQAVELADADSETEENIMSTTVASSDSTEASSDLPESTEIGSSDVSSEGSVTASPTGAPVVTETTAADAALALSFSVPTLATAVSETPDSMTISWAPVDDATQYNIYRFDSEKNDYVQAGTVDAEAEIPTEFTDEGLLAYTKYTYRVAAIVKISKELRENRDFVDVSAKTMAIAAPEGISAVSEEPYAITVSWEPVEGAEEYRIYRYIQEPMVLAKNEQAEPDAEEIDTYGNDGEEYLCIETVAADAEEPTQYVDTELSYGVKYFYEVTAVRSLSEEPEDAENLEEAAEIDEQTAEEVAETEQVTEETAEEGEPATEETAEGTGSVAEENTEAAAEEGELAAEGSEEAEDDTEEAEEASEDEADQEVVLESTRSETVSAKAIGIAAPTEVRAEKSGSDSITITWKPVSEAKYYNVYTYNYYVNRYVYIASVAPAAGQVSYVSRGLVSGVRYDYKVAAVGETSETDYESELSENVFATTEYVATPQPVQQAKPAETAKPAQETKPAETAKPAEETKPSEDTKAAEQPAAEPEKPAEETKPTEQTPAPQPAPAATTQVIVAGSLQGNAEMVWALGKTLGMTDAQCAGILGNMMCESGLDQTAVEGIFSEPFTIGVRKGPLFNGNSITNAMHVYTTQTLFGMYAARGLGINQYAYRFSNGLSCAGLGLIQFTGPLAEALLNYANAHGRNWYDLDLQMAMVIGGSAGTKARCIAFMNDTANAGTVNGATASWLGIMEMGLGGPSYGYGYGTRCSYAQYWYNILAPNSAAITAKYAGFAASVIAMAGL